MDLVVDRFIWLVEFIGWLLVFSFFVAFAWGANGCHWHCSGMDGDAFFLAFMLIFSAVPIGIILIIIGKLNWASRRKSQNAKRDGVHKHNPFVIEDEPQGISIRPFVAALALTIVFSLFKLT
jgi:uncharacterized membrane protein